MRQRFGSWKFVITTTQPQVTEKSMIVLVYVTTWTGVQLHGNRLVIAQGEAKYALYYYSLVRHCGSFKQLINANVNLHVQC